jgi:hypothetical protein
MPKIDILDHSEPSLRLYAPYFSLPSARQKEQNKKRDLKRTLKTCVSAWQVLQMKKKVYQQTWHAAFN